MSVLSQTLAVCRINVMGVAERPGAALVVVLGVACVIGVMLSVLSVTAGLARASTSGTDPRNAIVIATEAVSEDGSNITRDTCSALVQAPGVAHDANGRASVDCEMPRRFDASTFTTAVCCCRAPANVGSATAAATGTVPCAST